MIQLAVLHTISVWILLNSKKNLEVIHKAFLFASAFITYLRLEQSENSKWKHFFPIFTFDILGRNIWDKWVAN